MHLFTHNSNLSSFIKNEKKENRKIAFVPTMGALHEGHLSLIDIGKKYADDCVCSIYVNPSQFNNKEDLIKYPRNFDKDAYLLEARNCEILYAPSDVEVYPAGIDTTIQLDLGLLDKVMEGEFRPGHFKGMLQVVKRLLDLVQPDFLIMGQKDFQQFTLVHYMIQELHLPVKLIIGPTLRESNGLAMSSRNERLNQEERNRALSIYQCLLDLKTKIDTENMLILQSNAMDYLKKMGLKPEYVEIVDGRTLQTVNNPNHHDYLVACIAVWAGDVRLIDNLLLKGGLN